MEKLMLVIDGKSVQAEPGTSILEAAKLAGITIPTLCHDDGLEPYGACRMCTVEIQKHGRSKLVASCLYQVEEGLSVQTSSEKVRRIRKMIIELIWPAGQQYAAEYGVTESRFTPGMTDCSLCGMCVRYSTEVKKCNALYFKGRGIDRKPALVEEESSATCTTCGECFNLCSGGWVVASRC
jgi:NADH dehydrogenase/NADH:ubiquinone oxidoreductase subunit G